jgi:hypothetical protein
MAIIRAYPGRGVNAVPRQSFCQIAKALRGVLNAIRYEFGEKK